MIVRFLALSLLILLVGSTISANNNNSLLRFVDKSYEFFATHRKPSSSSSLADLKLVCIFNLFNSTSPSSSSSTDAAEISWFKLDSSLNQLKSYSYASMNVDDEYNYYDQQASDSLVDIKAHKIDSSNSNFNEAHLKFKSKVDDDFTHSTGVYLCKSNTKMPFNSTLNSQQFIQKISINGLNLPLLILLLLRFLDLLFMDPFGSFDWIFQKIMK